MDLEYYASWDYQRELKRFYATMTLHLEPPNVGQDIYMYLSFQDTYLEDINWDIARCHVPYDGNVNLPYRYYTVTDHMSV